MKDRKPVAKVSRFAKRITDARKSVKMTQTDFAKATGISQSFLSMVECGLHEPSLDFIRAVHRVTGRSYEWILDGKEPTGSQDLSEGITHAIQHLTPEQIQLWKILTSTYANSVGGVLRKEGTLPHDTKN